MGNVVEFLGKLFFWSKELKAFCISTLKKTNEGLSLRVCWIICEIDSRPQLDRPNWKGSRQLRIFFVIMPKWIFQLVEFLTLHLLNGVLINQSNDMRSIAWWSKLEDFLLLQCWLFLRLKSTRMQIHISPWPSSDRCASRQPRELCQICYSVSTAIGVVECICQGDH